MFPSFDDMHDVSIRENLPSNTNLQCFNSFGMYKWHWMAHVGEDDTMFTIVFKMCLKRLVQFLIKYGKVTCFQLKYQFRKLK